MTKLKSQSSWEEMFKSSVTLYSLHEVDLGKLAGARVVAG